MSRIILPTMTLAFVLLCIPVVLFSQGWDERIQVHLYPQALTPGDSLTDGLDGRELRIHEETFLVWVDLEPDMFFTHETCYILISKREIRIKHGRWWPVLNGKAILLGEHGRYAVISPFELPAGSGIPTNPKDLAVHVFPHELTSRDRIQDGPQEKFFRIHDNSMLLWVDLLPGAFFAHPTAYIFISKHDIRVEEGIWWPVLNGKDILHGQDNRVGIVSPFEISGRR
jgi:hypothetical protein